MTVNGLKYLKSITPNEKVIICVPKLKQSNMMEKYGTGTPIQKDVQTGYISKEEMCTSIDTSGKNTMVQSPKDTTSITSMKTQEITPCPILNVCPYPTIGKDTLCLKRTENSRQGKCQEILTFKTNAEHGINPKKDMSGTFSTESKIPNPYNLNSSHAPIVENPTRGMLLNLTTSALTLANQRLEEIRGLTTRKEFVKSVVKHSSETNTAKQDAVQDTVLQYSLQEIDEISDDFKNYLLSIEDVESVTEVGREDVYEITVEDAHDFFANGILTLQCDSMRYAVVTEHMYNRNFGTASLSLSVDEALKKSGILVPEDNTGM